MARWGEGYITDVAYTTGFYRELTPSWLWLTALLGGQRPPDIAHLAVPDAVAAQARASAAGFNAAVERTNWAGGELGVFVSPVIGSAVGADLLETFCRRELADAASLDEDRVKQRIKAGLRASDRSLLQDGKAVTDQTVQDTILTATTERLTGGQWALRRALGVYD